MLSRLIVNFLPPVLHNFLCIYARTREATLFLQLSSPTNEVTNKLFFVFYHSTVRYVNMHAINFQTFLAVAEAHKLSTFNPCHPRHQYRERPLNHNHKSFFFFPVAVPRRAWYLAAWRVWRKSKDNKLCRRRLISRCQIVSSSQHCTYASSWASLDPRNWIISARERMRKNIWPNCLTQNKQIMH